MQFVSFRYSRHQNLCPIAKLLKKYQTDITPHELDDTFSLAQNFGIDLGSIKQELELGSLGSLTPDPVDPMEVSPGTVKHIIETSKDGSIVKETISSAGTF